MKWKIFHFYRWIRFSLELRQCSSHHESSNTQHHFTTTMTLNSASGMTSSINNSVEDEQILDLQNRLQHSKNTQVS